MKNVCDPRHEYVPPPSFLRIFPGVIKVENVEKFSNLNKTFIMMYCTDIVNSISKFPYSWTALAFNKMVDFQILFLFMPTPHQHQVPSYNIKLRKSHSSFYQTITDSLVKSA